MNKSIVAGLLFAAGTSVVADVAVLDYSIAYSGDNKPSGELPWLRATLTDDKGELGAAVLLTFEATGLRGREFVSTWAFSLRESIDPGAIRISEVDRSRFDGKPDPELRRQDDVRGAGGYRFDFDLNLPTSESERFGEGSSYTIRLEREGGLSIYDLLVTASSRGYGDSVSVAHVQGLDSGGSVWISAGGRFSVPTGEAVAAVPEASTWAAGAALGGLVGASLLRRPRGHA